MRAILHVLAACILLGSIAWWWQAGSNKGWTKTSVTEMKLDEITEISYPVSVDRFVPGVDLLAVAAVGSALLFGAGFFLKKRRKPLA
ncbi:MAG: hypothetical protein MUF13_04570 [Akkermansiaceae bacterium]|jgi:hypothetical protein|nr:hypothetical protein [Akkermansiaceae bacterium]